MQIVQLDVYYSILLIQPFSQVQIVLSSSNKLPFYAGLKKVQSDSPGCRLVYQSAAWCATVHFDALQCDPTFQSLLLDRPSRVRISIQGLSTVICGSRAMFNVQNVMCPIQSDALKCSLMTQSAVSCPKLHSDDSKCSLMHQSAVWWLKVQSDAPFRCSQEQNNDA